MSGTLVDRLRRPGPLVTVELRPPRSGLSAAAGMDSWIDLNHSIRNLALKDVFVFLTDDAVGSLEEENLGHLAANVGSDVPLSRLVPFLTCKHTIEHCLLYADRAHSLGFEALTVVGGDTSVGRPRCVPHSSMLRQRIRERQPGLSLGGWTNPHRDVRRHSRAIDGFHPAKASGRGHSVAGLMSFSLPTGSQCRLRQVGEYSEELPIVFAFQSLELRKPVAGM